MPKKSMRSRSRSRQGGMWPFDSTTQGSSSTGSWYDNLNLFGEKKPDNTGYGITQYPSTSSGTGYSQQPPNTGYGYGGKKGKKGKRRRSMRGGNYSDNISTTNLAATAGSISGIPTASAQLVGGRTRHRRHRHRHSKSCKHRKH